MTPPAAIRAVLFDLDGTLADTLADLAHAVNHALVTLGQPTHPLAAYRHFVGDGARNLIHRALPATRPDLIEPALALMRAHYDAHCFDQTRLYPGIPELVAELRRRQLTLAVFSNKPDVFTKRMIAHYFPANPFAAVLGHVAGRPLKPDPTGARQITTELGLPAAQWLYLGDTDTDMRTAANAGMYPVGCLWGFRDRAELETHGARTLLAAPDELLRAGLLVP